MWRFYIINITFLSFNFVTRPELVTKAEIYLNSYLYSSCRKEYESNIHEESYENKIIKMYLYSVEDVPYIAPDFLSYYTIME